MEPGTGGLGRLLVGAGVALVLAGVLVQWLPSMPWLGRLPGDIRIERPGFRFYFPVATCVVISAVLSAAMYLMSRFK